MFFCFRTTLVDKRCVWPKGVRIEEYKGEVCFILFVCFYSFTVHLSDSKPNSFLSSKLYSKRVDGVRAWRGGGGGKGVLLGIFGGGVSPGPPNADPI